VKRFRDKVAVVTGAASGIGRALAGLCAEEEMKIVLADIEGKALAKAERELRKASADVLAVPTDVSRIEDVEELAAEAYGNFREVNLLFNNAGVSVSGSIWETTDSDWEWVIGVNLWGVIHGVRAFVPRMLKQNTKCHIVNTASISGLISNATYGSYGVSKHGVVALSETLYFELKKARAKVSVSVLCPQFVNTRMMDSERNRPTALSNEGLPRALIAKKRAEEQYLRKQTQKGMSPEEAAEKVFQAVREEQFYILTHRSMRASIRRRMESILQARNPRR